MIAGTAAVVAMLAGCSHAAGPGTALSPEDSPLQKYFAAIYGVEGGMEEQERALQEQQTQAENLIAACMSDAGFEYTPATTGVEISAATDWNPDDPDWVAAHGYGIVLGDSFPTTDDGATDPNGDYVSGLSEAESQAYFEALYGPPIDSDTQADVSLQDMGCFGRAQLQVTGEDPFASAEHKPLMDAIQEFYAAAPGAPEFEAVNREWSACMADEGVSQFDNPEAARESINDRQNALFERDPESSPDEAELAELKSDEIELAMNDLSCRTKVNYREKSLTVQFALEEKFIADHESELDAVLAEAEQRIR